MPRAVALFSGGLDSMLAVRILQLQGLEVEALTVSTLYHCSRGRAGAAAATLGVRLHAVPAGDDYLDVLRKPAHGYGKGANPCIDCRIHMCRLAGRLMAERRACVVATGEVLGQRPMSQKRKHLEIIEHESGLSGRLLRPLSAQRLAPTLAEQQGEIDRRRLFGFTGRSRRELLRLAGQLGLPPAAGPSPGCALTEPSFAARVFDLMRWRPEAGRWDFELLNHGRHFRCDPEIKVVVGRSEAENGAIERLAARADAPGAAWLRPDRFTGPAVLLVGPITDDALRLAAGLLVRYSGGAVPAGGRVLAAIGGQERPVQPDCGRAARAGEPL